MGALDQVTQMKGQGVPENEIINKLQEQGVSPKAINDAMDQFKIKDAVSRPVPGEGMEPSVVGSGTQPVDNSAKAQEARGVPNDEFYIPQPKPSYSGNQPPTQEYQEGAEQEYAQTYNQEPTNQNYPQGAEQEYGADYGGQTGYSEEYYPQEGYEQDYGSYGGGTTDTMIEIAEQVFAEKMRKMQKQLEDLNEFKTLAETKLTNTMNRLKRIENTIDKLQIAILEKVGSYGRGLDSIKKEMSMMQDSFSKTLPALVHRQTHHTTATPKPAIKKAVVKKNSVSRKKK